MRALYHEHRVALWRCAVRLTGDRAHAEDVAQEKLLARDVIIDERRSLRFRSEACVLDGSATPDHTGPDEVNAVLDRLLIGDAQAQHRAVIVRSYYLEWTTARIALDLRIAEGTVKSTATAGCGWTPPRVTSRTSARINCASWALKTPTRVEWSGAHD